MPPGKQNTHKAGTKIVKRSKQNLRPSTSCTGLWQQSLRPKPSQNFTLCEPGKYLGLSTEMRLQHETMFTMPVNIKLFGSWTRSEDSWYRKDREMLEYLQDFPVSKWLISPKDARSAYDAMQLRFRLRDEGKSVYADGVPGYWPYGKPGSGSLEDDQELHVDVPDPAEVEPAPSQPAAISDSAPLRPDPVEVEGPRPTIKVSTNDDNPTTKRPYQRKSASQTTTVPIDDASLDTRAVHTKKARKSVAASTALSPAGESAESITRRATRLNETAVAKNHGFTVFEAVLPASDVQQQANPRKRKALSPAPVGPIRDAAYLVPGVLHPAEQVHTDFFTENAHLEHETVVKKRKIQHNSDELEIRESKRMQRKAATPPPYDRDSDAVQKLPHCDFPWQNTWAADDPEEWDDSIYDPGRLIHLSTIHCRNAKIVTKYMENGKHGAQQRKEAALVEGLKKDRGEDGSILEGDGDANIGAVRPNKKRPKLKRSRNADQREHFSGRLDFADNEQEEKFKALKRYTTIEDAIKAAMINPFDEALKDIEVAHDPGDSLLDNLHLPRISIMDIARTRLQLSHVRIFTDTAAERLIDFCPDLLTNYHLLQVVSETKYGNTQVQIRLGQNGSMLSDSTITKRVSAALNREFDRTGAAEAAQQNPNFKKVNRDMYAKYKSWRAVKRQTGFQKVSQFILLESSRLHKAALEEGEPDENTHSRGKPKGRPKRVRKSVALIVDDFEEADSPSSGEEPSMALSDSDDADDDVDVSSDNDVDLVSFAAFEPAVDSVCQQSDARDELFETKQAEVRHVDPAVATQDDCGLELVQNAGGSIGVITRDVDENPAKESVKIRLSSRKRARNSSPGPRERGQKTLLDYYTGHDERPTKRRSAYQSQISKDSEEL
ncbi:hypothetical protein ANO11243_025840 [Dothideomycetidae sp. 11243]|nr:hypothetical protein ANO11243_025840 [fungal sp. No.11243]